MKKSSLPLLICGACAAAGGHAAESVKVMSAGSLNGALTAVIQLFKEKTGTDVKAEFGPAGVLLERIEAGEPTDVFASANMAHPRTLAQQGRASAPVVMARNRICAKARPDFGLTSRNLLDRMLDPRVNIGTSTPKADPGGDYAWAVFDKADKVKPGAGATLKAKAIQLAGGKNNPPVPAGRNAMDYFFEQHRIDLSIGYCSSRETTPDTKYASVEMPANLAIVADYGLTVLDKGPGSHEAALAFALFLMTPEAQHVIGTYGFEPVAESKGGD